MKKAYLVIFLLSCFLFLSLINEGSRECHILFDFSNKLKIESAKDNENQKFLLDPKGKFKLEILKIETKNAEKMLVDSVKKWSKSCESIETNIDFSCDTMSFNNIEVNSYKFKCIATSEKWVRHIYAFPSKSHLYKMDFGYPANKAEKGEREMFKILSSLSLSCN